MIKSVFNYIILAQLSCPAATNKQFHEFGMAYSLIKTLKINPFSLLLRKSVSPKLSCPVTDVGWRWTGHTAKRQSSSQCLVRAAYGVANVTQLVSSNMAGRWEVPYEWRFVAGKIIYKLGSLYEKHISGCIVMYLVTLRSSWTDLKQSSWWETPQIKHDAWFELSEAHPSYECCFSPSQRAPDMPTGRIIHVLRSLAVFPPVVFEVTSHPQSLSNINHHASFETVPLCRHLTNSSRIAQQWLPDIQNLMIQVWSLPE